MQIQIKPYSNEYLEGLTYLMNQWNPNWQFTAEVINNHINMITRETKSEILLAVDDQGNAVGYILITPCYYLGLEPFMEIVQILVDIHFRQKGIGEKLVLAAEEYSRGKGFNIIKLSSRVEKKEAHRLYIKMGYTKFKEAITFEKRLS